MKCLFLPKFRALCVLAAFYAVFCAVSCTFDYGEVLEGESSYPDITMEDLDYVRVRGGKPLARLQAETADRYENRHRMELKNYSFEQYNTTNNEIDAIGSGGFASVELDTSNIRMSNGIEIIVDTEDITLETERLDWDDGKKFLKGGDNDPVNVEQSDGTKFTGTGFSADVRARSWFVSYGASGVYIYDEENDNPSGGENDGLKNEEEADIEIEDEIDAEIEAENETANEAAFPASDN
ncbi:MAG: LPS export ABC transporter periplasmic protein LptC [Spirochaetaceae bacterium]|jgi:LPS export ABC transporter protein LptC|nr:LPS export ABC transporter periplasmic protein LptC [Spirochaetaceae bacterium]